MCDLFDTRARPQRPWNVRRRSHRPCNGWRALGRSNPVLKHLEDAECEGLIEPGRRGVRKVRPLRATWSDHADGVLHTAKTQRKRSPRVGTATSPSYPPACGISTTKRCRATGAAPIAGPPSRPTPRCDAPRTLNHRQRSPRVRTGGGTEDEATASALTARSNGAFARTLSATSTRCCKRRRRCSQPRASMRRCGKSPTVPASGSARSTAISPARRSRRGARTT